MSVESPNSPRDYYPSQLFRRIPNKNHLPDYHEIIKNPIAISTLKQKIQTKKYNAVSEFLHDFAQIIHNAQVYNRPNSQPVKDAFTLKAVFEQELRNLADAGLITEEETGLPYLGEIPDASPEPDPVSDEDEDEDEEGEDEGEDDEDDDEADDSDDENKRRRRSRARRGSAAGRKLARDEDEEGGKGDGESQKVRGRPPRVDTPMEARIKAILKGIRKPRDDAGHLRIRHFDRLPDKQANPHYYQEIKEPIAVDIIKRKAKRKKYNSLDHFTKDLDLMFRNAMEYNQDESDIYKDAVELQAEAHRLADAERAKPDSEYMEDGRLPLPDGIQYKNETWKVGDWVHIQNPNDVTKPIVAQVYRTWQDAEGQKWVNACWYYRPEQTVHQFEKHFFPNEVVKTGKYRDHHIEEVVDRCFVMFVTRYGRGRPRGLPPATEVYVCEARYNEEKHRFNKIKTWASCLPDEVRDKDYEMDLFDVPRKIKKVPSPILHLLKDEAEPSDELPQPEWGHKNAPPRIGGVHRQPRDENQSPPPEPTPPPPTPPPPQPARLPSVPAMPPQQARGSIDQQGGSNAPQLQQPTRPSATVATPFQAAPASATPTAAYRQNSFPQIPVPLSYSVAQTPTPHQPAPYAAQHQLHPPPSLAAAHPTSYAAGTPSQPYARSRIPVPPLGGQHPPHPVQYPSYQAPRHLESRQPEVYTLSDSANASIPKEIRDQYPQDEEGRVLFFTTPPVDHRPLATGRSAREKNKPLMHSEAYLAAKAEREKKIAEARRQREQSIDGDDHIHRPKAFSFGGEERDADGRIKADPVKAQEIAARHEQLEAKKKVQVRRLKDGLLKESMIAWLERHTKDTDDFYSFHHGERAGQVAALDDLAYRQLRQDGADERRQRQEVGKKHSSDVPRYRYDIYHDVWKPHLDDFDARLPRY